MKTIKFITKPYIVENKEFDIPLGILNSPYTYRLEEKTRFYCSKILLNDEETRIFFNKDIAFFWISTEEVKCNFQIIEKSSVSIDKLKDILRQLVGKKYQVL